MKILIFIVLALVCRFAFANVLGDMQTFSPNTDGLDFISVHSGRPLPKGYFVFSNYLNYAKDHLLVYKSLDEQNRIDYHDSLIEYDFGIAYSATDNFQLSLQAPILLKHETSEQDGEMVILSEGMHSIRPGFKWSLPSSNAVNVALLGSIDFPRVSNSPYTGTDPQPIYNLESALTWAKASHIQSVNLGIRFRNPTDLPTNAHMFPLKNQVTASYGFSDRFSSTARWVFETFVSYPLDKDPYKNAMDASSVDVLLGMKHRWVKNLNFDWGGTIEPGVQTLAPKWRVFAGLVYYWTPNKEEAPGGPTPPPEKQVEPLAFTLENYQVYTGSSITVAAIGGVQAYSFSIIKGQGTMGENGFYEAPLRPQVVSIRVTDQSGRSAQAKISVVAPPKADKSITLFNLEFVSGTAQLTPTAKKMFDKNLQNLRKVNIKRMVIEGHTDSVGSDEYNQRLSRLRAETLKELLSAELGLNPENVQALGYGESKPIATNDTSKGRQKNRRVILRVYYRNL